MSVTLTALTAMVDGATEANTQAAVADYSSRNPLRFYAEISRNAGNEKAYDLPTDFLKLVKLVETGLPGYYIVNGLMTFTARPDSDTLHIWYAGQHLLDDANIYPFLQESEAHIIALKLRAIVTNGDTTEYRAGDVQVKRDITHFEQQYLEAVKVAIGAVGLRSQYTDLDMAGLR
jgi:hypothetical protein